MFGGIGVGGSALPSKAFLDDDKGGGRLGARMSSPERFEAKQLLASGVLTAEDRVDYDADHGLLFDAEEGHEEEAEIEIAEEEPPFLRGQTHLSRELSPVKVIKNPDGSMSRAAMTQSALAKERRELREQQERQLLD